MTPTERLILEALDELLLRALLPSPLDVTMSGLHARVHNALRELADSPGTEQQPANPVDWKPAGAPRPPYYAGTMEEFDFAMGVLSEIGITTLEVPIKIQPDLIRFLTETPGGERFKDTDWAKPFTVNGVEIRVECAAVLETAPLC